MEFKGTQGEWVFIHEEMNIRGDLKNGFYEASICDVSANRDYSRGMTTQCYNAQLIAAAPELLEALISLVNIDEIDVHEAWNIRQRASSAIHKALGL